MRHGNWIRAAALAAALLTGVGPAFGAAPAAAEAAGAPAAGGDGGAALVLPEDLPLKTLVDLVGKRLGVNFVYDETVLAPVKVTIKTPTPIPADSLMALLTSVLRMKGLSMAPTDVPGLMRIERLTSLASASTGPEATVAAVPGAAAVAVTRVFRPAHVAPSRLSEVLKPFLSASAANLTAVPEHGLLIVTDYAGNMDRLSELLALVDRPGALVRVRFVPVVHLEAEALSQKLQQILAGKSRAEAGAAPAAPGAAGGAARRAGGGPALWADERTNQVIVLGTEAELDDVVGLIQALDVPLGLETKVYAFQIASARQVHTLVERLVGEPAVGRLYTAAVEPEANLLVVTATPEIHAQVAGLREAMDRPVPEAQSPIRFYKLENAKAADVLATLQSIEGDAGLADVVIDGVSVETGGPAKVEYVSRGPTQADANRTAADVLATARGAGPAAEGGVSLEGARVMADEASNTIIVIARPAVHPVYEKLIRRLDVRRPQVLVEATIVTLDTTDGFELGVELMGDKDTDDGNLLLFSQFGLTTRDPAAGAVALNPGTGFNGALLGADTADFVINALKEDDRAKVVARPSVLINDNATGVLLSEIEEPFSSINAFTSGTTTESFAGYSTAGTKITITPQISEGDHLKLEYEITLSSFNDDGTDVLPPSRETNSLTSEATIPDGHTIVVGGLTRDDIQESIDRVPFLGSIPVLELLFSNRDERTRQMTLFVFIHARILRHDRFEDLKVLSRTAAMEADLEPDYPSSEPVEIH